MQTIPQGINTTKLRHCISQNGPTVTSRVINILHNKSQSDLTGKKILNLQEEFHKFYHVGVLKHKSNYIRWRSSSTRTLV